jgi:anti-sigma regulatory factor (Ser/Thr protein kinase)
MTSDEQQSPVLLDEAFEPTIVVSGQIRQRVRALLSQAKIKGAAAEDVLLVVHELVANVVDHAKTPFRLVLRQPDSVMQIYVQDESKRSPEMRPADNRAFRGRGLRMISSIAERWGFQEEGDGKTVWAIIPV